MAIDRIDQLFWTEMHTMAAVSACHPQAFNHLLTSQG
jgi:hypothetical protein